MDETTVADRLLRALASGETTALDPLLCEDAALRLWRWDGCEAVRPRARVVERLTAERSAWIDPVARMLCGVSAGGRAALEFQIQAVEAGRLVEHNRAAVLRLRGERIQEIDLYCSAPVPSARRTGWIAPPTLTEEELHRLFSSLPYVSDLREWIPPDFAGRRSLGLRSAGSDDAHPGGNEVGDTRWSLGEADARIEEVIAHHRARGQGFRWIVGPYDTPADLGARLLRHGLVRAGEQAIMARLGIDRLELPANPDVSIEVLSGADPGPIDALMHIVARCFHWTPEQAIERRPGLVERLENPAFREAETWYLARVGGAPAGYAQLELKAGIAFLAGAATHPDHRRRHVYSTLLSRRLEDARARGYHLAAIVAEPMSRRVVGRRGFKEYARSTVYAWMPVIDMDVIRGLVSTE